MQGQPSKSGDRLWDIPISTPSPSRAVLSSLLPTPKPPTQSLNVIIHKDKTAHDLVNYLHAACFSPTKKTFLNVIRNNFLTTWPGLPQELVKKHHIDTEHFGDLLCSFVHYFTQLFFGRWNLDRTNICDC